MKKELWIKQADLSLLSSYILFGNPDKNAAILTASGAVCSSFPVTAPFHYNAQFSGVGVLITKPPNPSPGTSSYWSAED